MISLLSLFYIARFSYLIFSPELIGKVNSVCFPIGKVLFEDILSIYHGPVDERIGCVSVSVSKLLKELMLNI